MPDATRDHRSTGALSRRVGPSVVLRASLAAAWAMPAVAVAAVFPGATWETRTPAEVGMDATDLDAVRDYLGGRGAIVKNGYLVYAWGEPARRGDIASAAKPWYAHFLFEAVEQGRLASLDAPALDYQPCLADLNPDLGLKDRSITFRHMANQVSCYGVSEAPGTAYDYNDWQMALFWDALFLGVWGTTFDDVDAEVLGPELGSILGFEDGPTLMAFGTRDRAGRLAVSPRDHCRFGLLYLNRGEWDGTRVLSEEHATMAVSDPIPLAIPRTTATAAEMCPGQRTIGSTRVPDDQTDHDGGYSWLWWVNGVRRSGARWWPDADPDVYASLGHRNGKRGLAVMPCRGVVLAWNDTTLDSRPSVPHPLNEVFRLLLASLGESASVPPVGIGNVLYASARRGPGAGEMTVELSWSGDPGRPRPPDDHYHVERGPEPGALELVAGVEPLVATDYAETAPLATPDLTFYRVLAANGCELVSGD